MQIRDIEGLLSCSDFHCWQLKAGSNICSVHVQAYPQSNEQLLRHQVQQLLKRHQLQQITVQVEKENTLLLSNSNQWQQRSSENAIPSFHLQIEN